MTYQVNNIPLLVIHVVAPFYYLILGIFYLSPNNNITAISSIFLKVVYFMFSYFSDTYGMFLKSRFCLLTFISINKSKSNCKFSKKLNEISKQEGTTNPCYLCHLDHLVVHFQSRFFIYNKAKLQHLC